MHQLKRTDLPALLKGLKEKLARKTYPPSNVHGYLLADEVMRQEGRTADNSDRQHWFVDNWPGFRVVMLQEGLPSDSRCPMRAVWAEDAAAASAFFADPAVRIPEFWLGGIDPAFLDSLRADYDFYVDAPYEILALGPTGVNALPSEEDCARAGLHGSVSSNDAEQVAAHVTYPCPAEYIRMILSYGLPSVAARLTSDGTLVAWALTQPYLALGMVNVMPEHRRTGLGRAVVALLTRRQLTRGLMSYAYVSNDNAASKQLFMSLGYQKVGVAHWTGCKRRSPNLDEARANLLL